LATVRRSDNISPESRFLPDGAVIFTRRRAARSALFRFLQTAHAVIGGEIPPLSFPASVAALLVSALLSGRSECRRAALPWQVRFAAQSEKRISDLGLP
jgi:hypothetical protein